MYMERDEDEDEDEGGLIWGRGAHEFIGAQQKTFSE